MDSRAEGRGKVASMWARYRLGWMLVCNVACGEEALSPAGDAGGELAHAHDPSGTSAADSGGAAEAARPLPSGGFDHVVEVDAAVSAGAAAAASDASSTTEAGAPCNALRPNMFSVALAVSTGQLSELPQGGMIHDGTYRLDEATLYDPDPNRAQGVREMRVETLKIEGDVWQHVAYWNGEPTTRFTHRASLRANFVSLGLSCGSEFDARVFSGLRHPSNGTYTALPQMLTLQVIGDGEAGHVYVLKYLRIE